MTITWSGPDTGWIAFVGSAGVRQEGLIFSKVARHYKMRFSRKVKATKKVAEEFSSKIHNSNIPLAKLYCRPPYGLTKLCTTIFNPLTICDNKI